uniref:Uncharacterized protein n=1 Tax=viral metagenome TaxID=1070528 RepID=A0A6M3JPL1_9ZZZZ
MQEGIMNQKEFNKLKEGDIIVSKGSGNAYIIVNRISSSNQPDKKFTVVRVIEASNPDGWEKVL